MIPLIMGHRGVVEYGYENCLSAVSIAKSLNVFAIEVDARVTRDKQAIVFHDESIKMPDETCYYIKDCDYKDIKKNRLYIPLLKDMLTGCKQNDIFLNVEIKCLDKDIETPKIICNNIKRYGNKQSVVISSFCLKALEIAKYIATDFDIMFIVKKIPENWVDSLIKYRCKGIVVSIDHNHLNDIIKMKEFNYSIYVYTVNEKEMFQRLISLGIGVITDFPHTFSKYI
jgi:glycerophosphoryl diester phosphodiesterase